MFARHRSLLSLSVLLGVSACKGGDPVQEICELLVTCPCSAPPYATAEECVSGINMQTDALKTYADGQGLTFDQGCFEKSFEQLQDQVGCGTEFTASNASCSYCAILHGDKPAGAACTSSGGFSDCAANLLCADDVCVDICARLGAGDVCAMTVGDTTSTIGSCATGLYCDLGDTKSCKALLGAGEVCDTFLGNCQDGLVCSADMKCGPPPAAGEACVFECAGDLVCENSTCTAAPGDSEPCTANGECGAGLECGDINSCVPIEPLLCQFLSNDGF